ncbi:MAG: hypothetical protein KatS3mg076_2442 [Candidatus Binatia bacterium]|nr:MAG: hypothetical protein KatS3mg076_2442 [Candidatus Binatia bacterium]
MEHFAAVEAGVQHPDAHRHHGVGLGFELADQGVRVGDVRSDDLGIAPLELGVQLVQVLGQTGGVVLRDGKDNRLAGAGILPGGQLLVVLPGQAVEFLHHQAVRRLVGEAALELGRIVVLVVHVGALGEDLGDARREAVGYEVLVTEGILDGVGEVGLARLALVELVGVALDVVGGRGGEPDVDGVELRERRLPGAVDRAVALVGDHHVEVTGRVLVDASDHRLEQRHGDLLFLPRHAGAQPIARVRRKQVLDRLERLLGELVAIDQEENPLGPTCPEKALEIEADQVGLPGPGGQLDQEAALPELEGVVEGAHRVGLVEPHGARLALPDVVLGNLDRGKRSAAASHLHQTLEVAPREKPRNRPRVVVLPVPEVGELPVREKNEGRAEGLGVRERLLLGNVRVDRVFFGLDHRERAATMVVEDVVGAAAVGSLASGAGSRTQTNSPITRRSPSALGSNTSGL